MERYRARLSGPLLDRIDLHVRIARVPVEQLRAAAPGEPSAAIRARVVAARERQRARGAINARLRGPLLRRHGSLDDAGGVLLESAASRGGLSARGFDRIRRVARTIADLAGAERIAREHVAEALLYRRITSKP